MLSPYHLHGRVVMQVLSACSSTSSSRSSVVRDSTWCYGEQVVVTRCLSYFLKACVKFEKTFFFYYQADIFYKR